MLGWRRRWEHFDSERFDSTVMAKSPIPTPVPVILPTALTTISHGSYPPGSPDHPLSIPPPAFPDPIPGILTFGTVNVFAGAPGAGKTTMLADWCRRWQRGQTICGHATNMPTGICYLAGDRGGNAARLIFLQAGVDDLNFYSPMEDSAFDEATLLNHRVALDSMRLAIDALNPQPGNVLIIDPAAPFYVPGSSNDPRAVAAMLWALHTIARQRQITIIVVGHFHKQPTDPNARYRRPQDRISGSGAWSGFSDTQIYLIDPEPPTQPYHILGWVPRQSAPEDFKFQRDQTGFIPYQSLEDVGVKMPVPEQAYHLLQLIPDGGITSADLLLAAATTLSIGRSIVFRYLKELDVLGVVTRPYGRVERVALERVVPSAETPGN